MYVYIASLRLSCAPTKPLEEGQYFVAKTSTFEGWVRNSNIVLRKGQSIRCDVLAKGSRPACTVALTVEDIANDGSAESIEVIIIIMRGMCMGWGVAEIVFALFVTHTLLKICRYFIPVEY